METTYLWRGGSMLNNGSSDVDVGCGGTQG